MNGHTFNGAVLNGASTATFTIRAVINMVAEALVATNNRVNRKDNLNLTASAVVTNAIGRVRFRDSLAVQVSAQVSIVERMRARAVSAVSAVADIVTGAYWYARSIVTVQAVAQDVQSTARVRARDEVNISASANSGYVAKNFVKFGLYASPPQAIASITVNGLVKPRTNITAPLSLPASAVIVSNSLLRSRGPVSFSAEAFITPRLPIIRLRAPVNAPAVASIIANAAGFKQIPFDRVAPAERQFFVPAVQNQFSVS
jgi:hypothetical protein